MAQPGLSQQRARSRTHARSRRSREFWLLVGPFTVGLVTFTFVPILWGLVISFFRAYNTVTPDQFVGLENYRDLISDPAFRDSLVTGLVFAVVVIPLTFIGALGLALLVHKVPVGSGFFRSLFFIPAACSYVVGALIWKTNLLNSLSFGFVNTLIGIAGIQPVGWMTSIEPPLYWIPVVTVRLWLQMGPYMIIFLAGLQEIPSVLYEAAAVDGAKSGWQQLRHITLPGLRNSSIAILGLLLIAGVQAFDEFYNLFQNNNTAGLPSGLSVVARPPMLYLYNVAFRDSNFGRGTAGTFIVTAILIVLVVLPAVRLRFGREERD